MYRRGAGRLYYPKAFSIVGANLAYQELDAHWPVIVTLAALDALAFGEVELDPLANRAGVNVGLDGWAATLLVPTSSGGVWCYTRREYREIDADRPVSITVDHTDPWWVGIKTVAERG